MKTWAVQEITDRYRVTPQAVYNWLKRGVLKGSKNPETGRWEVTQAVLANFKRPRRGQEPRPPVASGTIIADQPFISLQDIAKRYGVGYYTAREWARRGYIPAVQISPRGQWFIPRSKLAQLEQRVAQTSERTTPTTPEGED